MELSIIKGLRVLVKSFKNSLIGLNEHRKGDIIEIEKSDSTPEELKPIEGKTLKVDGVKTTYGEIKKKGFSFFGLKKKTYIVTEIQTKKKK
jgi:hypothetical protein